MKKKGILALLVLLLIVVMIGCKAESQPQEEVAQATESNEVEQSAPIESDKPVEPSEKVDEVQPMMALVEVTQEDLEMFFQQSYDFGHIYADFGYDEDYVLSAELESIQSTATAALGFKFPEDLEAQYLAWRETNYPKEPEATKAPSSNPQTQPSTNNQAQPVSNQTGPGGPTIVDDYGNPATLDNPGAGDGSLETGGQYVDWSQVRTSEEAGFAPEDPAHYIYSGN